MFHTCIQNERSFDNFLIDIKNIPKTYEFGRLEDCLILDRIVCCIDSKDITERLLKDSKFYAEQGWKFGKSIRKFKN